MKVIQFIKINAGVLQGEPLSPALFNIYIFDLASCLEYNNAMSMKLYRKFIDLLLFADDIILMANSKSELQKKIN